MVYLLTVSININHSWMGKCTIVPWILWVREIDHPKKYPEKITFRNLIGKFADGIHLKGWILLTFGWFDVFKWCSENAAKVWNFFGGIGYISR